MPVLIEYLVTKGLQALDATFVVREANFELTNGAKRLSDLIATADKPQVAEPLGRRIAVPPRVSPRKELRAGPSIKMHVRAAIRRSNFAYNVGNGNCYVCPNGMCFAFPMLETRSFGLVSTAPPYTHQIASLKRSEAATSIRHAAVV